MMPVVCVRVKPKRYRVPGGLTDVWASWLEPQFGRRHVSKHSGGHEGEDKREKKTKKSSVARK